MSPDTASAAVRYRVVVVELAEVMSTVYVMTSIDVTASGAQVRF